MVGLGTTNDCPTIRGRLDYGWPDLEIFLNVSSGVECRGVECSIVGCSGIMA